MEMKGNTNKTPKYQLFRAVFEFSDVSQTDYKKDIILCFLFLICFSFLNWFSYLYNCLLGKNG